MMDVVLIASFVLVGSSAVLLLFYALGVQRDIEASRLETTRFPLYGVRRGLVQLVAEEVMAEDDEAWANLYTSVNAVLQEERFNVTLLARAYVIFLDKLEREPDFRVEIERRRTVAARAEQAVPEFKRLNAATSEAIASILFRRLSRTRMLWLLFLSVVAKLGIQRARAVVHRAQHPAPDEVTAFVANRPRVAVLEGHP